MGMQAITECFGNTYVMFLAKDFPDVATPAVRRFCLYGLIRASERAQGQQAVPFVTTDMIAARSTASSGCDLLGLCVS